MQLDLRFAGIIARVKENVCIVTSQAPLTALSLTIVGVGSVLKCPVRLPLGGGGSTS